MKSASKKILKLIIGTAIAAVILYFILAQLTTGWSEVSESLKRANWLGAAIGIIITAFSLVLSAIVWKRIMQDCYGIRLSWLKAFILINLANVLRYIPGRFWVVFGIAYFAKRWKIDEQTALVVAFLNEMLVIVAAFLLGAVLLWGKGLKIFPWWAGILLLAAAIAILQPRVLHYLLSLFFRFKGKKMASPPPKMHISTLVIGVLIMCILWLGVGAGLTIAGKSILPSVDYRDFPALTGGFVLSYVAGYVSIFTPSGLGVREGALLFLLPETMSAPDRAAFSIATRLWMTLAELLNVIVALVIFRIIRKEKEKSVSPQPSP